MSKEYKTIHWITLALTALPLTIALLYFVVTALNTVFAIVVVMLAFAVSIGLGWWHLTKEDDQDDHGHEDHEEKEHDQ